MTVVVAGARVHVVDCGTGPPVLFLHGNPDSSDLWTDVIAHLSQHYRCLAPDLPGFGRSERPPDPDYSLAGMARFPEGLLDALSLTEPICLVVHDFGGPFGLAWALHHPERVRRIAVINTVFHADYRWHFWARVWRTPLLGELSMALMNRWTFAYELRRGSPGLTREQIGRVYALVSPSMKRTVLRLYRSVAAQVFAAAQRELLQMTAETPTLVLWGDRDPYIPRTYAERFGATEVHHFPDYGHWLPAESPGEVATALERFLSG